MALVKSAQNRGNNITYVSLSRGPDAGFKHSVNKPDGQGGTTKAVESYENVTGIPVGFSFKQELTYDTVKVLRDKGVNPRNEDLAKYEDWQKKYVATVLLKDPETTEVIGVNFDMHDSLGGKVIGMLNSARIHEATDHDMSLRTYFAPPKSKYNDSDKGRSSVNMRPNGSDKREDDIVPIYLDGEGNIVMDPQDPNKYGKLPMGVEVPMPKGKPVWTFEARDDMISATALAVLEHFKRPETAPVEAESGIDLDEAAGAAAPRG